jgi:antitoxin YefM
MMPLEDFSSWQETAYLLGNPANAGHVRQSITESHEGRLGVRELDES